MQLFPFSLRLTIPSILLLIGCLAGGFSYQRQISLAHERTQIAVTERNKSTAATTAQLLEYFYRKASKTHSIEGGVTLVLSRLLAYTEFSLVLFCDERNSIQYASHYAWRNQDLPNTPLADILPLVEEVRQRQAGQVFLSRDRKYIRSIYPIVFPPPPGELRSRQIGVIILESDLSKSLQQAIADAGRQSFETISILAALCVLVGLILDRIVTQRAEKLMSASHQLTQGNLQVRVFLQGSDELAKISFAFNDMVAQIQQNTEALQQSEHQLKITLQELSKTQSQLVQQEKMSGLGQLVAGIAHEINNPVNFIHGNLKYVQDYTENLLNLLQLYQEQYPDSTPEIHAEIEAIDLNFLQEDLGKILKSMKLGTDRIRHIVLSLRIFSRLDESEFKDIDIHEGLESALLLLRHRLHAKPDSPEITIVRNYDRLPRVECYAGLLNQVFMNILTNAIDALEERNSQETPHPCPGQIAITTSVVTSNWVKITIADNGSGIPPAIQNRIFEPFFTTKPVGKGTGMGMSISYQIITEKHQGKIECSSTVGKGTEFSIYIPIQQAVSPRATSLSQSADTADLTPQEENPLSFNK